MILDKLDKTSPVICLMGPTASGKTDLAIELSKQLPCDLISVDSAMVYKNLDIGSAKPAPDVLEKYPHQLINICEPEQVYSAAQFREDAILAIKKSHQQQRLPLLVGGTMLYFKILQQGIADLPSADPVIREKLVKQAQQYGWEYLHDYLKKIDPVSAQRIHPNDPQRMQRAIEIYELTGKPMSALWSEAQNQTKTKSNNNQFNFINLALELDRKILHQRIEQRFDQMLEQGFISEVEMLYAKKNQGIHADLPAIKSAGYQQAWKFLSGEYDEKTFREKAIVATRQLAKRQITWLRSWPKVNFFYALEDSLVNKTLQYIREEL